MYIEKVITINLTEEEKKVLKEAIKILDYIDTQIDNLNIDIHDTQTFFDKEKCQDLANCAFNDLTDFLNYMKVV